MKIFRFQNISIKAISAAVPRTKISNLHDHQFVDEEDRVKATKFTGIREYRITSSEICASDLCQAAAETLFSHLSLDRDTIDAVLFVTQTPDYRLPATACVLQHKLGLQRETIAYDINLGCSGYLYGLYTACSFIQGGGLKRILLLCGDTQTKLSYRKDRNVCFLLGDAGTASIIERNSNATETKFVLMTDGSRYDKLIVPAGGFRTPTTKFTRQITIQQDGGERSLEHIFMDGMDIFSFSTSDVVNTIKEFLLAEGLALDQIDYLILHQANKFMTDRIAKKLKFPLERALYSIDVYGNTSSASVPLTITHHFATSKLMQKQRCLISGFGVGLSWGVAHVVFDNLLCPPIEEIG